MSAAIQSSQVIGGGGVLPAAARLGAAELTVSDLNQSIGFYEQVIGLQMWSREGSVAKLGAGELSASGEPVLVLHENPLGRKKARHAGLYHVALLFSGAKELARAARRLEAARYPIEGASDHQTHEALYLSDPDGNGLELAWDRPRDQWPDLSDAANDFQSMGPTPLNFAGLLSTIEGESVPARADDQLRVGHIHLHVGDLSEGRRFYLEGLGFDEVMTLPTAVFVSAGGYHHHVAFNVWQGRGAKPAPAGTFGLKRWTLVVPTQKDVQDVAGRLLRQGVEVDAQGDGSVAAVDRSNIAVLIRSEEGTA